MSEKLEIYKMAVEMADRVSSRRLKANAFFLSINTAVVTLIGFLYKDIGLDKLSAILIMSSVGLLLSFVWLFAIRSYKRLNKAKFDIIHQLEKGLSFNYFKREWDALTESTTSTENEIPTLRNRWMKIKDRYTELTNIEAAVPIVFLIVYILIYINATNI